MRTFLNSLALALFVAAGGSAALACDRCGGQCPGPAPGGPSAYGYGGPVTAPPGGCPCGCGRCAGPFGPGGPQAGYPYGPPQPPYRGPGDGGYPAPGGPAPAAWAQQGGAPRYPQGASPGYGQSPYLPDGATFTGAVPQRYAGRGQQFAPPSPYQPGGYGPGAPVVGGTGGPFPPDGAAGPGSPAPWAIHPGW